MPELTASQSDAIDYRRQDACVVAGPGSGKTTVLVERYRALVEEHRLQPREILAITFTEKAAANMKSKLAELFAHDPLRLREVDAGYVSTVHGFCARLLRDNAIAAGIDPRFSVMDARESEDLQYSCLHDAFDQLVEHRREDAIGLIAALQEPDLAGHLQSAYDGIRSAGVAIAEVRAMPNPGRAASPRESAEHLRELLTRWPQTLTHARRTQRSELLEWVQKLEETGGSPANELVRVIKECPLHLGRVPEGEKEVLREFKEDSLPALIAWAVDAQTARFRAMIFDVLARFDELYNERKLADGRLDFNDLERRTIDLLRGNEDVRNRVRAQFRQIMLDESQDINAQQAELIRLVRGEDVFFAVGDVNQSIYGFRHARPAIFQDYEANTRNAGKHSTQLLENFRSRGEILLSIEALLNAAEGIVPRELVAGLAFPRKALPCIEILKVQDVDKDEAPAKEARWIAHRILSLRGTLRIGTGESVRHADFSDFAVLCRNGDSMTPVLDAFNRANIPYVCGRRQSFLLSREGLDITSLLHSIANPRNGIALAAVLRSSLVGLADEALLRLRLLANSLASGLNMIAHDPAKLAEFAPEDAAKLARFTGNLERWRADRPVTPLEVLIVRALSDCGFQWIPGTVTASNVESFLHLARAAQGGDDRGLAGLLREIESLQKAVNLESDLSDKDQGNCVQVMTAHSAKGLEFPVTIIAAMDKGTKTGTAPATFTPESGLGLTWKDPAGKPKNPGLDDSWQLRNTELLEDREKREANRLLYVAMTRAEEHLILSYSQTRGRTSPWVRMLDRFFKLDKRTPADRPAIEAVASLAGEPFDVSILVTDAEPPPLRADTFDLAGSPEVLTIPRPAAGDRHDSAVNVTSLAVFADCPRKYYLERYIGWNGRFSRFDPEDLPAAAEADNDIGAADLGSLVHEMLAGKSGNYPPDAQRLANVFLNSGLGHRAAAATRAAREWDFIVDIHGTLVRGSIDLWFEENGEFVVVDYKTDLKQRPEAYAPQLALYALAMERAFGKRPSEAWLHYLRSDTAVAVPLDDDAVRRVENLLTELAEAQDTLRFDLHETAHCHTCPFYRNLCPAGRSRAA